MKKLLEKTLGILAVLTITSSLSLHGMEEARQRVRERYLAHQREVEEQQRREEEQQREAEQRHAAEVRLAQAQETLAPLVDNPNLVDMRGELQRALEDQDPDIMEAAIIQAREALTAQQHDRIDPLLDTANQTIERARRSPTPASEGSIIRAMQDLRYHVGVLTDGRNPLSGEYLATVTAKLRELEEQHTALTEELNRQEAERRAGLERHAPSRSERASSSTEVPANLRQLQAIQNRISLAERTASEEGASSAALKTELGLLRKELVRFIGKCYTENKEYLRGQAVLTKDQLDARIESLERSERMVPATSQEAADEALARQLEEEGRSS